VHLNEDEDWSVVPVEVQRRFEAGVERIRVLHGKIAADANVGHMPPVTVAAEGWSPDGERWIHGMAGAWRDDNAPGGFSLGVLLSAGPALCEDEATVRAVMVHEFAHCFQIARVVVDHNDLGTPLDVLQGDSMDRERERKLLANPSDWFGPGDVEILHWNDERMQPATKEVVDLIRSQQILGRQPPLVERASFNVPLEWKEHIRRTRRST